ncbi:hypothetical protein [Agrilutibacter solisilvae]|uniref:Uncharacterized protein n=1 Tax=Agrilutibacter solisilvae TaxID=2763317 RepID=A0A975AR68_9GAMM|nr:hypothetical protein [Lysobacter solisilvae]QSX77362.1 hypothetical protein I8J32_011355 [Lysobacter solisilvae]
MFQEIHDSLLVAYSVDSEHQALMFSLLPHHGCAREPFALVFTGVAAHSFPEPLLPAILLDIQAVPAADLLREHWPLLERGSRSNGWPGPWAGSLLEAVSFAAAQELRGFEVSSSYGLNGWLLAKDVRMAPAP